MDCNYEEIKSEEIDELINELPDKNEHNTITVPLEDLLLHEDDEEYGCKYQDNHYDRRFCTKDTVHVNYTSGVRCAEDNGKEKSSRSGLPYLLMCSCLICGFIWGRYYQLTF
jgi:hypothetical protein